MERAAEQERERVAREIHDVLAHTLGALRGAAAPGPDELPALVRVLQEESAIPCHLFSKIGARDRGQAVAYAYRQGLQKIPDAHR